MKLKVAFVDFWGGFDNRFFVWLLKNAGYDVEVVNNFPDLVIHSQFGSHNRSFSCKKVYYTGENIRALDKGFSMTYDFSDNPAHLRVPLYTLVRWYWANDGGNLANDPSITLNTIVTEKNKFKDELLNEKPYFCAFIQSNGTCLHRNEFFQKLNARKSVKSAGGFLNNIGLTIAPNKKLEYLKKFKFMITFENTQQFGYTSEKIIEPMLVDTIPVYWGSTSVSSEFNSKSFIDANSMSIDDLVNRVLEIDSDDDLYYQMYKQPHLIDNTLTPWLDFNNISNFFKKIINDEIRL